jgi:imidazolonepropionase-like amidohydrolase
MRHLYLVVLALLIGPLQAQVYFPDNTDIKSSMDIPVAFTGGTIHVSPNTSIEKGTLLIHKDRIIKVGAEIDLPKRVRVIDVSGHHLYPSFIDMYTDFGISDIPKAKSQGQPQYGPNRKGHYWNDHIRPGQTAMDYYAFDEKRAEKLRSQGFGSVQTHAEDGVIRGTGMVLGLHDSESTIIQNESAQFLGFTRSQQSRQAYPNSIMGYTALLRQVYHDLDAYEQNLLDRKDLSLEALAKNRDLPQIFEAKSLLNIMRAAQIAELTEQEFIYVTGGDEYQRLDKLKALQAKLIVPVDFPDAYDMENPFLADHVSLSDMKHWEHAPFNPRWLHEHGLEFALSTTELDKPENFLSHIQQAIDRGLAIETALEALTTRPAKWLGLDNELGQLKEGYRASFFITHKPVFTKKSKIVEHWVLGHAYRFSERGPLDLTGEYQMEYGTDTLALSLTKKGSSYSGKLLRDSTKLPLEIQYDDPWLFLTFRAQDSTDSPLLRARVQERDAVTLVGTILQEAGKTSGFALTKQ